MTSENLYSLLDRSFTAAGGRAAIRSPRGDPILSYAELRRAACHYANALEALGVEPGDRVTVQVEKSIANALVYLAVLKIGAIYQPLNPAYTDTEVEYFVGDAEPRVIVCDPLRQHSFKNLGGHHKVAATVTLDSKGEGSLASLASRMEDRHETVASAAGDLAGLLYTSGTTGRSKGAMITHGNLSSNAQTLVKLWGCRSDDVLLHALPIFHVHGLYVALNTAFLSGSEIIWFETFEADAAAAALPQATLMMGVPTFYTRLLKTPAFTRESCRTMRLFISGSAPLSAGTHREFEARTGHAILERYGMTETGMIASNPLAGARVAGTVGFALPGVSLRIGGTQPGIIEVKGPNVFKGYWRNPEKTAEDFTGDGYFITGDVGTMDAEGRVNITGRAKDIIISGGFNVYPTEIEEAINGIAGIAESAAVGVPHPDLGEGMIAAVTARGPLAPETDIIAALATRLAKFKIPKRIFVIDELPRNAMGKVQKAELRKRYANTFTE
ncbi:MAG: AMP-binding protein [Rhizobiales bacterium]|nr:AMP-binding protein [Hyphomicrobiales bacterium]